MYRRYYRYNDVSPGINVPKFGDNQIKVQEVKEKIEPEHKPAIEKTEPEHEPAEVHEDSRIESVNKEYIEDVSIEKEEEKVTAVSRILDEKPKEEDISKTEGRDRGFGSKIFGRMRQNGRIFGLFETEDLILILILLILLQEECDDDMLMIAIIFLLFGGGLV